MNVYYLNRSNQTLLIANNFYPSSLRKLKQHVPAPALVQRPPPIDVRLKLTALIHQDLFQSRVAGTHYGLPKILQAMVDVLMLELVHLDRCPNRHLWHVSVRPHNRNCFGGVQENVVEDILDSATGETWIYHTLLLWHHLGSRLLTESHPLGHIVVGWEQQ